MSCSVSTALKRCNTHVKGLLLGAAVKDHDLADDPLQYVLKLALILVLPVSEPRARRARRTRMASSSSAVMPMSSWPISSKPLIQIWPE